jgi:hypothetical protein
MTMKKYYYLPHWGHWEASIYVTVDPPSTRLSYLRLHKVWSRSFQVGVQGPADLADKSILSDFERVKGVLEARGYALRT